MGSAKPSRSLTALLLAIAGMAAAAGGARAERLENQVAVFAALDKVTARISRIEAPLNQTVEFGSLKVTPRVCYTREPTDPPKTTSFIEVDEVQLDKTEKRIFSGWMFAESPGLNGVEHPVFDIWLTGCDKPLKAQVAGPARPQQPGAAAQTAPAASAARPRPKR